MKTSMLCLIVAGALAIALPAAAASTAPPRHWHKVATVDPDKAKHDAKTPAHTEKTAAPAKGRHHAAAKADKADSPAKGHKAAAKHGRHHHATPAKKSHGRHAAKGKTRHGHKPAAKHGRRRHAAAPVGHVHHWHLRKHAN